MEIAAHWPQSIYTHDCQAQWRSVADRGCYARVILWLSEGNYSSSLREVLMKRCNILKGMPGEIEVGQGLRTRGDLDTTRHLVLYRISIRREVYWQQDISTTGHVIMEGNRR